MVTTSGRHQWSAHHVVFGLLHAGEDVTGRPYQRLRAALETLFTGHGSETPLTFRPSTTDPAAAREWREWTAAGLDGPCFKRLVEPCVRAPGRGGSTSTRCGPPPKSSSVPSPAPSPRSGRYRAATTQRTVQYTGGRSTTLFWAAAGPRPTCRPRRRMIRTL